MKRFIFALTLIAATLSSWTLRAQDAPAPEPTAIDVLFVGDSITDFWDNDGWGATKLGLKVFKQYYDGPRKVINIGVSGDTWEQTMGRLDQERVANIKPTLIQLMIGTNNLDRGGDTQNPAYTADGIGKIIEKLKTKWPEAKILLLGVFPRGFEKGNHYQTRIDEINKLIQKYADNKTVFYKDIGEIFLTAEGKLDPALFPDQLHPNEAGYYKWAAAVEPFFKEVLGGPTVKPVPRMPERHAQKLEEIKKADGKIDLVYLGDSITHNWERQGKEAWAKYYGNRRAINLGFGGDRTENVLWRLENGEADGYSPKGVILMIGTNNTRACTPTQIVEGIRACIEKIGEKWPEAKVLLLAIFPRGADDNDVLRQKINKINEILPKLCDGDRVTFQSINDLFLSEGGVLSRDVMPDLLHPAAPEYFKWAEAVEPFVNKVLGGVAVNPVPRDKWWPERHNQKLDEIKKAEGKIDVVYLGDSITHNWESKGKEVWEKNYADKNIINLGFSGDRTEHVLWRLDNGEADGYTPKLVILMIGTNNIGHRSTTPAETVEGVRAILKKLGDKWPETKVLLLAVFPRGADENDGFRKQVNEINAGLPALCDGKRVVFLNFNDKFLTEDGVLSRDVMPDLLHPAPAQYNIWAEAVEPFIKEALGE